MNKKKENKRIHIDLLNTNQKTPQKEKKTEKNGGELINPGRLGKFISISATCSVIVRRHEYPPSWISNVPTYTRLYLIHVSTGGRSFAIIFTY